MALMGCGQSLADQVIPDDLIVQGSECVGFDCVNNESFGFDTIWLKENNLRIMFVDTSTISGFPSRDWQVVANSSASGGESYFGIRDCGTSNPGGASECGTRTFAVAGGAPANSIFVSSTGRVGFRTATPVLDLHVRTGNTPAHRLDQDGSSGFSPQTWDIAGNEANFFVRDVTGGSRLPFRIRPGAPTSSIDIAASGNVGIGTASPQARLYVLQAGTPITAAAATVGVFQRSGATGDNAVVSIIAGTDANSTLSFGNSADQLAGRFVYSHDVDALRTFVNGAERLRIDSSGNVGIGTTAPTARLHTTGTVRLAGVANCSAGIASDLDGNLSCITSSRRFKHLEGELAPAIAVANVMALRPRVGSYSATPDETEHWLIAEEVAAVDRALVGLRDGEPYTVKTQNVVADLVAVIQEQQRRIEALERAIGR